MSQPFEPSDDVVRAVESLLDVATSTATNSDDETFTECHLCGEWEGHADGCPVPVLLAWQST